MQLIQRTFLQALTVTTVFGGSVLSGCKQEPAPPAAVVEMDETSSELKWARAALERNPELQVVSVDKEHHAIKIVVKATGETINVPPSELAAIPTAHLAALTADAKAAREQAPRVTEEPIPPTPQAEPPAEKVATDFKVVRQDGRMRITGPGVNIESSDPSLSAAQSSAKQKFDEPIICEGKHMLHLDRRRLNVDGDAIIARGGCELHLTNSEIKATGTAIVVQDATVHVGNSIIQGAGASFDAGPDSRMFLSDTRFTGIARRDAQAKVTDQGGNFWR